MHCSDQGSIPWPGNFFLSFLLAGTAVLGSLPCNAQPVLKVLHLAQFGKCHLCVSPFRSLDHRPSPRFSRHPPTPTHHLEPVSDTQTVTVAEQSCESIASTNQPALFRDERDAFNQVESVAMASKAAIKRVSFQPIPMRL